MACMHGLFHPELQVLNISLIHEVYIRFELVAI